MRWPHTFVSRRTALLVMLGAAACRPAFEVPAAAAPDGPVPSDPVFTAISTDGASAQGRLRAISADGAVTLVKADGAEVVLPLDRLFKLTREGFTPSLAPEASVVLFPEGDRLFRAPIVASNDVSVEVQSYSLANLSVPLESILGVVFAVPRPPETLEELVQRVRTEPRTSEVLWLANHDKLAVGFQSLGDKFIDYLSAGKTERIERARVSAIGFDPSLVSYPRPENGFLELTFSDGSRLGVREPRVEKGQVVGVTRFGAPVKVPFSELTKIHARTSSVVYLSERTPRGDRYVPYVGPPRSFRRDLTVEGQTLKLAGQEYDRGIGTQSRTLLAFPLEPGDRRFQATVGVDDRAGPLGSVVFRVLVDKREAYVSQPLTSGGPPKAVDVDVTGGGVVILVTEFGERGGVRDIADWVEARIIR